MRDTEAPGAGRQGGAGDGPSTISSRGLARAATFLRVRYGSVEAPARLVVFLFVVVSMLALTVSIILTPPGQVPDAPAQFDRAVEVSQGGFVGLVRGGKSGDFLPTGVGRFEEAFGPLIFNAAAKVTRSEFDRATHSVWGRRRQFVAFGGTTQYPPLAYLPGALAVWIARSLSTRVVVAYYLLEFFNAIAFVSLVAWALALFRGVASSLLAAVALLPMMVALAGSPSTDGIIVGLAAVFAGILYRRLDGNHAHGAGRSEIVSSPRRGLAGWVPELSWLEWIALCALGVVVLAKPAYFPLVLAMGLVQARQRNLLGYLQRVVPLGLLLGVALACWYRLGARIQGAYAVAGPSVSPVRQLKFILAHPGSTAHVASATLRLDSNFYWHSFVGILGWLDTPLESWLYLGVIVGLGVLLAIRLVTGKRDWATLICCAAVVIFSAALIFIALYLDWSPVGSRVVVGVQGRYFLPLAPVIILALGVDRPRVAWGALWWRLSAAVWLAMACLAVAGASAALVGRYWLT